MPVPDDVRRYLRELGATDEEIDDASDHRLLPGLAADLILRRGASLTAADVAAEIGLDAPFVIEAYRLLGINVREGVPMFSSADLALLRMVVDPSSPELVLVGVDYMLRVVATSLARIADAVVSMYVQDVESSFAGGPGDPTRSLPWVETNARSAEMALQLGDALGPLFRLHLLEAILRQRASQEGMTERALSRVAVGFVDLVGFTPLSRSLPTRELVELVRRFDTSAFDIAAERGGRVVKHIGDEVMFTAIDADDAARIALALVTAFEGEVQPRGGLAYGEVLTVHGDFYGPVVNLASRLTDGAVPGEILIDDATRAALAEVRSEPAGRRMLKGFDEPVTVCSLVG